MPPYGAHLRHRREELWKRDRRYSLRQVAMRAGIEPAQAKGDRAREVRNCRQAAHRGVLARDLGEDPDVLLAIASKISTNLKEIVLRLPRFSTEPRRKLKNAPDNALLKRAPQVREGKW